MSIQAIKAIDGIRFSVWSPTEVRKYSVAEILLLKHMMKMECQFKVVLWMVD